MIWGPTTTEEVTLDPDSEKHIPAPIVPNRQTKKRPTIDRLVGEQARKCAERQFLSVEWARFHAACENHVSWREFYFWFCCIVEHAGKIPPIHLPTIQEKCPQLFRLLPRSTRQATSPDKLVATLETWIDDHQTCRSQSEGWFDALTYFSARQPRIVQAQSYYLDCTKRWRSLETLDYPDFQSWLEQSARFDPSPFLVPERRSGWASVFRVSQDKLQQAAQKYLDLEVFAYWSRTALKLPEAQMAPHVRSEIERQLPQFLDSDWRTHNETIAITQPLWPQLLKTIREQYFHEALENRWIEAIDLHADFHPLHVRVLQFWRVWDREYLSSESRHYPALTEWRSQLDSFTGR